MSIKKPIHAFLIFSLFSFPMAVFFGSSQEPLIIDDFEGGRYSWDVFKAATDINVTVDTVSEYSPQGSWHLVWTVKSPCTQKEAKRSR